MSRLEQISQARANIELAQEEIKGIASKINDPSASAAAIQELALQINRASEKVREAEAKINKENLFFYSIVASVLGLVSLAAVFGIIFLAFNNGGSAPSDALIAIGSGAVGALAGVMKML